MCRRHTRAISFLRSIFVSAGVIAILASASASAVAAGSLDMPRWPAHAEWGQYVVAPANTDVTPIRVVSTSGGVTGANTLAEPGGGGRVRLAYSVGAPMPSVEVDYGKDVGGIPYFVVKSESGSPVLRAAYSEGLQYLGAAGDRTPSASPAGDPSRVDDLAVAYPGTLTTGYIQGGQRFERITLASPGTVTLSSIGIRFTAVRTTAPQFRGWFDSSSRQLNRIWFDGAYTTQLDELPPGSVPAAWTIAEGALYAVDGSVGILGRGLGWTDYTMTFDTRVVNDEAEWVVHSTSPSSGYLIVLRATATKTGVRDALLEIAIGASEFSVISDVILPRTFDAARWHHVATAVSGDWVTTSLDGRKVAAFDTAALPSGASVYSAGTVGFAALGSAAMFRDLKVSNPQGSVLYANELSHRSALTDFPGPNVLSPDPLPMIMDGAKRDRVVWSGDLGVEVPNVFYTTEAADYARESLELLASYQVADGESGTNVNPTEPLGTFPESGSTYSAAYSMDEVNNIATYYLYTGDLSFVRAEWPMITRELAYNRSMVDSRDLLVTDAGNGMDWDHYDGAKTGEVTAYNDIYYEALKSASSMAYALGLTNQSVSYFLDAMKLRVSINRYLFEPARDLYSLSNRHPAAVAQDANALAVLFGIAPNNKDAAILRATSKALPSTPYGSLPFTSDTRYRAAVSPFVTSEEVQALFTSGGTAEATSLIGSLWGYMVAPGPDDTRADWELVSAHGSPGFGEATSLAHGWSSGATADLSSYVLGVEPTSPGFGHWMVKPRPGSLAWVEGDVPTPQGTISVRWAQDRANGRFSMRVAAPARTSGIIWVPVPRSALITIRVGGTSQHPRSRLVTGVARSGTYVPFLARGGLTYVVGVSPTA